MKLLHVCEVCDLKEILTPDEAYAAGWDYPPRMGVFGVVSPRTCPKCPIAETVWWALAMVGRTLDQLTDKQRAAVARILAEPASIAAPCEN
ncbi:hypothetical protein [Mycolicibacter virginiensis]|uniref:hypothetical protein n=1 Tax=Mycolicibacter virginiensis TaxID=1795032 RepID=UPI001F0354AC|nr:hypothetical protein [Mycolicibacter virginiensis]ULP48019.1 hypothetical protein MJO54_02285 [Mycolicibacter virginiensis]